ncbi:MAG: hypothetical protein ACKOTF_14420 [Opitutaceae bacterium]
MARSSRGLRRLAEQSRTGAARAAYPDLPNARWIAMRLLGGDDRVASALRRGELAGLADRARGARAGLFSDATAAAR